MLKVFTWQEFLIAALVFSLVWLVVGGLLFYRKELLGLLSGRVFGDAGNGSGKEPLPHAWQDDFEGIGDEGLMGRPALPDGVGIVSQGDFGFRSRGDLGADLGDVSDLGVEHALDPGVGIADPDELLQSDVFDLMEDLKPVLQDVSLSRAELIEAVNDRVGAFPRLLKSPLLLSVYEQVAALVNDSELGFEVSAADLREGL